MVWLRDLLKNPAADWGLRLFFIGILMLYLLTRFPALDFKPFHHDESLFSTYGYQELTLGNYFHHPLLHGPLQMQLLSFVFWAAEKVGALAPHGNTTARLLSVACGFFLLLVIPAFRKKIGREGIILALIWIVVSPGIWYYQRFVRNESLFLLTTLALVAAVYKAWRSPNPSKWIVAACFLAALLIAEKENCLFVFFNGVFFLCIAYLFERTNNSSARFLRQSPAATRSLWKSFQTQRYAWIIGLSIAFALLSVAYTNGFQWKESFPGFYLKIMRYWGGQHEEHRLYGEFHHYLPVLFLYEPIVMCILLIGIVRLIFHPARILGGSILLASIVFGLWMGSIGNKWLSSYLPQSQVPKEQEAGNLLGWLHMTQPWHLALACAIGWITIWGAWVCLRQKKVFRSWLVVWTGFGFLQYSYAGEKVPWLTLHIILPAILLAADFLGEWWRKNTNNFGRQQAVVAIVSLFWILNALQGYRLCFIHPTNPGELLVYNHTQFPLHDFAMEMRREIPGLKGKASPLIQGEATWPLVWYLRDHPYITGIEQKGWSTAPFIVCDVSYAQKHPELSQRFDLVSIPFRQAFTPHHAPLRLFKRQKPIGNPDMEEGLYTMNFQKELYGIGAWKTLLHYIITRDPWAPSLTADPLDVYVGHNRNSKNNPAKPNPSPR